MRYRFCPDCGAPLTVHSAGDDGLVPYCGNCSKYWFDTFKSCVMILVYNDCGEIVLQREAHISKDYDIFVSGFITPGESAESAAKREVREELGIDLESLEYVGSYPDPNDDILMFCYLGFSRKTELRLSDELISASWTPVLRAAETMYPETPYNYMYPAYRYLLKKLGLAE